MMIYIPVEVTKQEAKKRLEYLKQVQNACSGMLMTRLTIGSVISSDTWTNAVVVPALIQALEEALGREVLS